LCKDRFFIPAPSHRGLALRPLKSQYSTEVPDITLISVKFYGHLDPGGIDAESIIVRNHNLVAVSGRVAVEVNMDKNCSTLNFNLDHPLAPAATPHATVIAGIKNLQGKDLSNDYSRSFTTWND